ncbi:Flagellar cap protein FliD [Cupriavidus sp. U2]|uniref:flagellar filament capping protein FliD n=1 Tax=Cupriavidus sp. U2 TaxID=2920269 RepID=UPI00129E4A17|nr:flagellar filament capping protein FliD [Cupriavidus sp. U2]KAI3590815.1 Flagellar cap protein FliD [Cupriavidus sp. U2]
MTSVSSLGIGSGLQLNTLLDQLTTAESAPLTQIQSQQSSFQAKLSAYGTLQSVLSAFQSTASKLGSAATFQAVKASASNTAVMTVATSTSAAAGSYAINVTGLAQSQSLVSVGVAKQDAAVVTGTLPATLTFDFGTVTGYDSTTGAYNPPGFNATAGSTKTVTIDSSNNSLQGIRDAINKANIGVTASLVNDGSGTPYHLVMTSTNTGAANSMRISSSSADLQNLIGFDPAAMNASTATTANGVRQTVRATDATLTVNGIAVISASNTVKEAAQGVTMTLSQTGTTNLTVTSDTDSMKAAVNAFVSGYNNLQAAANQLTAFDTSAGTNSPLTGDSVLRNIQTRLRGLMNTPQSGGAYTMLSQIGVSFQKDGTMSVNDTKLSAALASNPGGVAQLFGGDGTKGGIGRQIDSTISGFSDTNGMLKSAQDGINQTLKDLSAQYASEQSRINDTIANYRTQFTALDLAVSQMNQTSSYLTQQFSAMNGTSSKK